MRAWSGKWRGSDFEISWKKRLNIERFIFTFFLPEVERLFDERFGSRDGIKELVAGDGDGDDKLGMKLNLLDWRGLALLGTP